MDDSHSRFRKFLEKPREPAQGKPSPLASPGRFGKQQPAPPAAVAVEESSDRRLERFLQQPIPLAAVPDAPAEVEVDEPSGAQPFQRCVSCEADSSRYAVVCRNCGIRLDTPEQRAFNEWIWARRREEDSQTNAALAEMHAARPSQTEESQQQRQLGEMLAREVAEREHGRLDWMDLANHHPRNRETPGLRLLRHIPSTRLRLMVSLMLFGVGCVMAYVFVRGNAAGRITSMIFFWAMISLFVPGGQRRWPFRRTF